jgi:hypothetical protein
LIAQGRRRSTTDVTSSTKEATTNGFLTKGRPVASSAAHTLGSSTAPLTKTKRSACAARVARTRWNQSMPVPSGSSTSEITASKVVVDRARSASASVAHATTWKRRKIRKKAPRNSS